MAVTPAMQPTNSLHLQQGVGFGRPTLVPLDFANDNSTAISLSKKRRRFDKSLLMAASGVFASVLAIVMLLSKCTAYDSGASIPGLAIRAISEDGEASSSKRLKLCEATEAESGASTPPRRTGLVQPLDPIEQLDLAYKETAAAVRDWQANPMGLRDPEALGLFTLGKRHQLGSETGSDSSSHLVSATRTYSVIQYSPSLTPAAGSAPSPAPEPTAQDVLVAANILVSMRQKAAQSSTSTSGDTKYDNSRDTKEPGAVLQTSIGLPGSSKPPPSQAFTSRSPLENLLLAAQTLEKEGLSTHNSSNPGTSSAPASPPASSSKGFSLRRGTGTFDINRAVSRSAAKPQLLDAYWRVNSLLIKDVLDHSDLKLLGRSAEKLVADILHRATPDIPGETPYMIVCDLARRVLALEALVRSLKALRVTPGQWWSAVAAKFPSEYPHFTPYDARERFYQVLANRLMGALSILKTGVLPSDDEIRQIKSMLFFSPLSPHGIKNSRWNFWGCPEKGKCEDN